MPTDPLSVYDIDRDDPRFDPSTIRWIPANENGSEVVIVGVIHDHPASVHRVSAVIRAVDPEIVALELPPLVLPAFESYARTDTIPPDRGGEFSAAMQAAPDARYVGIDGPSRSFFKELVLEIGRQRPSGRVLCRVVRSIGSILRDVGNRRVATGIERYFAIEFSVDTTIPYECTARDTPFRQAADESRQVARSWSLLRAATPPEPIQLRESARESGMVHQLRSLRTDGMVVAVVGLDHLDPVYGALRCDRADRGVDRWKSSTSTSNH